MDSGTTTFWVPAAVTWMIWQGLAWLPGAWGQSEPGASAAQPRSVSRAGTACALQLGWQPCARLPGSWSRQSGRQSYEGALRKGSKVFFPFWKGDSKRGCFMHDVKMNFHSPGQRWMENRQRAACLPASWVKVSSHEYVVLYRCLESPKSCGAVHAVQDTEPCTGQGS